MGKRPKGGVARQGSAGWLEQRQWWVLTAAVVAVLAWLLGRRGAASGAADDVEADHEPDEVDVKLDAVRMALLSSSGGSAFDRTASGKPAAEGAAQRKNSFADSSYWDKRYASTSKERYDWYATWHSESKLQMRPHVLPFMPQDANRVLHVGCGNSRLAEELSSDGYADIVNIDISDVSIQAMKRSSERPGMSFLQMDATNMSFPDGSFDVVFEKGTLDALYTGSTELVLKAVGEVFRILRPGGLFVSMSFGAPHSRKELNATQAGVWQRFVTTALDEDGRLIGPSASASSKGRAESVTGQGAFYLYLMSK